MVQLQIARKPCIEITKDMDTRSLNEDTVLHKNKWRTIINVIDLVFDLAYFSFDLCSLPPNLRDKRCSSCCGLLGASSVD